VVWWWPVPEVPEWFPVEGTGLVMSTTLLIADTDTGPDTEADTECTTPTAAWGAMLLFLDDLEGYAALVGTLRRWPPAASHRHQMPFKAPAR